MGASNVYIGYHSFKHSGAILGTTEGQARKKQYVFKFMRMVYMGPVITLLLF